MALPGPAAVLVPRIPVAGFGCRPLEPVGPWPTGVCAVQPTSASHAGHNPPGQCGAIGETSARGPIAADRNGPARRMTTPERLVLGAGRRALVPPGSGACATDSSRVHRIRKPLWLIKVRVDTEEPRRTGESYAKILTESGDEHRPARSTKWDTRSPHPAGCCGGGRARGVAGRQRTPTRLAQVGQACQPCALSTFSAISICCDRVAWLAVPA
jgi:hypothetical protein